MTSLLLLLACKIVESPPAFQTPANEPPPVEPAQKAGAAAGAITQELRAKVPTPRTLKAVVVPHALIWAEANLLHRTLGELRQGQLVLVGEKGPSVRWRDGDATLVQVQAQGREGWMIAEELRPQTLPAWGVALSGPFDPFANPERICEQLAPPPHAGGEFRLLAQESGEKVRYEAACLEKGEDGSTTPATRQGLASILEFAAVQEVKSCTQRLEGLGSTSEDLKKAWPQDPSVCEVLKISAVEPPFPSTKTTWKIDLEGGDAPAEGFVADGRWLATHATDGKRVFDGPDYVLLATESNGRFQVVRLGLSPASVLTVLDKPLTGDGGEAFGLAGDGKVEGDKGTHCEWVPGRKQYYRCN